MRPAPLVLALAGLAALPAAASAHHATIACDLERPGSYVVVADYLHLNPVTTFGEAGATVTWSDRYVVRLPYPTGCVAPAPPPSPPPTPPAAPTEPPAAPQALPETPAAPTVIVPGAVEPQPRNRATPRTIKTRTSRIVGIHACTRLGQRPYTVRLITTTWRRGGKALRVTRSTVRVWGPVCRLAVAG